LDLVPVALGGALDGLRVVGPRVGGVGVGLGGFGGHGGMLGGMGTGQGTAAHKRPPIGRQRGPRRECPGPAGMTAVTQPPAYSPRRKDRLTSQHAKRTCTMTPAIQTHALTRHFSGQYGVTDLDLCVPAGAVYGFLGPNGAGKTTTIRLLLGLL